MIYPEALSSRILQWLHWLTCLVSLCTHPNEFLWPTSHQKDQPSWPVHAATCISSWAVPGKYPTSNQACLSYPTLKDPFALASPCECLCFRLCIALLCVLLFMSLEIQPHRKCCGPLRGVTSSVQVNRGWGRAKALSPLCFFWFVSWTTNMLLLAYFPPS